MYSRTFLLSALENMLYIIHKRESKTKKKNKMHITHLDGGDDEQVLKVLVRREVRLAEHDHFQQFNQLIRQFRSHKRLPTI
jgi:hypothetical protein